MLRRGGEDSTTSSGSSRTLPQSDARFCDESPASGGRRRRRSGPTIPSSTSTSASFTTMKHGCSVTRSNGPEESARNNQPKLRGLLKLIAGQIETSAASSAAMMQRDNNCGSLVSVYRYHGESLRRSQLELQAKPRSRRRRRRLQQQQQEQEQEQEQQEQQEQQRHQQHEESSFLALPTDEECGVSAAAASGSALFSAPSHLEHSSTDLPFATVVARKRFAAFFVVQGHERAASSEDSCFDDHCYSVHTLALRQRLARDYHDVMSTFVLDLTPKAPRFRGGGARGGERDDDFCDRDPDVEQNRRSAFHRGGSSSSSGTAGFCLGTGFAVLPTASSHNVPTLLTLLGGIRRVPAVVVVDTSNGRALPRDAFLAVQTNDPHLVIQRWQRAGKKRDCCWCPSGLTPCQTLGRALLCESEDYSCCVVQ